jgi:hypothetical protein
MALHADDNGAPTAWLQIKKKARLWRCGSVSEPERRDGSSRWRINTAVQEGYRGGRRGARARPMACICDGMTVPAAAAPHSHRPRSRLGPRCRGCELTG